MNKQIITIIGMVFLINFVGAVNIIAGNDEIITLEVLPSSCMIVDSQNNSLLNYTFDGLNFTIEGNEVTVNTNPLLKPDNYSLICNYSLTEEEEEDSKPSGSGICYRGWKTTEWADCLNDKQIRNVTRDRYGECYQTKQEEPAKEKDCEIIKDEEPVEEVEDSKNKTYWIIIIVAGIGLLLIIWVLISKG